VVGVIVYAACVAKSNDAEFADTVIALVVVTLPPIYPLVFTLTVASSYVVGRVTVILPVAELTAMVPIGGENYVLATYTEAAPIALVAWAA